MSRNILFALFACLVVGASAFASDCSCPCGSSRDSRHVGNDGVYMRNGKVMVVRDGATSEIAQEVSYNGGRVLLDGTLIRADGSRLMLSENQWISIDGPYGDARNDNQANSERELSRDGYFRQNGKVMVYRNGAATELTEDATLDNGTRILRDGSIVTRDGTRSRFEDNQRINFNGTISVNRTRDSVNSSYRQTQENDRSREGYYRQDGKVMIFRNGSATELTEDTTLENGTRIMRDGSIVTREGTRSRFEDNQRIGLNGTITVNQSRDAVNSSYNHNQDNKTNENANRDGANRNNGRNEQTNPRQDQPKINDVNEGNRNPANSRNTDPRNDVKSEIRTDNKAENKPENRTENKTESSRDNRNGSKVESSPEKGTENKTESSRDNRTENK